MQIHNHNLSQFLEIEVFQALWNRLDSAFPEFGFIKKGRYWMATVESTTRRLPGLPRPDRVRVYQNTPFGMVIHGAEFVTWIAYVSGTHSPRGGEFVKAVRKLAVLAGVSFPEIISHPKDYQQKLFETVSRLVQIELLGEGGGKAREYLEKSRGLTRFDLPGMEIGLFPSPSDLLRDLKLNGFSRGEINQSEILSDSRWEGRIIGPWRNTSGQIINFWSRDITGKAGHSEKYLMLKGGKKSVLYGLNSVRGKDLILVEGILDAITLRNFGVDGAVALGGVMLKCDQIDNLKFLGCDSLTVNLDYDGPNGAGYQGTLHAVEMLSNASFPVFVIPPEAMSDLTAPSRKVDPDIFIRKNGLEAYQNLVDKSVHLYRYKAGLLIDKYKAGPNMTDHQMAALIQDANVYSFRILKQPKREIDFYVFFWQEIIQELEMDWKIGYRPIQCQPHPIKLQSNRILES